MDFTLILLTYFFYFSSAFEIGDVKSSNSRFNTLGKLRANGYPAEGHTVVTEDGYILEIHRAPHGRFNQGRRDRPVVLLMHGINSASDTYVNPGTVRGIAYIMADAGFDVWMGNARGNRYCRNHIHLNPDDPIEKFQFFNYSFHEIGYYDLAAMVDYILNHTGKESLHYVGHSQGGTAFYVLNSVRTEYNKKFLSAHTMAGVGYMEHFPNSILAGVARTEQILYPLSLRLGIVEFMSSASEFSPDGQTSNSCLADPSFDYLCAVFGVTELNRITSQRNPLQEARDSTGGVAVKQLAHYGQIIRDKTFRKWNYNTHNNIQTYGTENPPAYNLSEIYVNSTLYYSMNDELLGEDDVLAMARDMQSAVARRVPRDSFDHNDYLSAHDSREYVIELIIADIHKMERLSRTSSAENISNKMGLLLVGLFVNIFVYFFK